MPGTTVSFVSGLCAFPDEAPSGYVLAESAWGEAVRAREGISESDLGKAVAAGVQVRRVVVVEVAATAELAPFLLLSDRPGWHHIALRRYEGPKSWGDYRILRRVLAGFGYRGMLRVVPQGHPFLSRIGIE
ncbi:hypothetical protein GCM10009416_33640 [Craurococcus roseus]|uniref:Uncharacterized protein n=1 Tax=Craurococcus roseus TaxID=77585 RepID=A0ABP3QKI1_9PROT